MKNHYWLIFLFLITLSACQSVKGQPPEKQVLETTQTTMTRSPIENITEPPERTVHPTSSIVYSTLETPAPGTAQNIRRHPVINYYGEDLYETLFTVPINSESPIQYQSYADSIHGPIAIGVLPNHHFLISDFEGNQLVEYDLSGVFIRNIDLTLMGIGHVRDMRISGSIIVLLEISYEKYYVHLLSLEGTLLSSEEIPYQFPIGNGNTLESSLTGIALNCEGNILLEIEGGSILYPLEFVQTHENADTIINGYPCYDQVYTINYALEGEPKIIAGDEIFQTELTSIRGSLRILNILNDGDIYIVRSDLVNSQNLIIDETIHFFSADRSLLGVARLPDFENYYSIMRDTAVGPDGEVYYLLLRSDSISIIRLNFYSEIEPLIPGVVIPTISLLVP